jgi:glyoxylase-like metal-dependent hydrolase (beta-lactamase superfamily II)
MTPEPQYDLFVECLNIGQFGVNTYIVACPVTQKGVIIDPGGEDDKVIRMIEQNKITPLYIINTHGHRDHVHSNATLSSYFDIPVCMHMDDKAFFKNHTLFQNDDIKAAYHIDVDLHHNDTITVGALDIRIIHTPGHTPGSVCLYVNSCLFTGDTLFVGDAGRTDLPGGNLKTLIQSIKNRILPLPVDTIIFPGHNYGETQTSTLEREIKENIYITDFILSPD